MKKLSARTWFRWLTAGVCLWALAPAPTAAASKLKVVATTEDLAALAREVGGD